MNLTVLMNPGPWLPVPPRGYGGIENVVATLVPELRRLGVRVVMATVPQSTLEVDGRLHTLDRPMFESVAAPYNQVCGVTLAHMHAMTSALRDGLEVDLVHDHVEVVGPAVLVAMGDAAPPTLQTLHWDLAKHAEFYSTFDGRGRVRFAAVSQSQLDRAPENLRRQAVGVVPLAVPEPPALDLARGEHLVSLARITAAKGQDVAARVCRRAGVPLVLAGPVAGVSDPVDLERRLTDGDDRLATHPDVVFFRRHVAPLLDADRVRWVGGVEGEDKELLLQTARALITPVRWAEPGATAVVEALVRGVPVLGTPLGVLPSLVQHGVTGFLYDDEDGLVRSVGELDRLDPDACRAAAAPWTPAAMAARYVELYDRVLAGAGA